MPFLLILALLIIGGVVLWFISHSLLIAFAIGMVMGISLIVLGFRKLARKSKKSLIASELFLGVTGYKSTIRSPERYEVIPKGIPKETIKINPKYTASKDYAEIIDVLKSMKFSTTEAKQAAEHVMATNPDKPLEDRVKMALQFLGDYKNVTKKD